MTDGAKAALAAKGATKEIPIVMAAVSDPVGLGLVPSLARPGGKLHRHGQRGGPENMVKRLELLKEIVPESADVAVLVNRAIARTA